MQQKQNKRHQQQQFILSQSSEKSGSGLLSAVLPLQSPGDFLPCLSQLLAHFFVVVVGFPCLAIVFSPFLGGGFVSVSFLIF